jgi:hypothetical protein
MGVVVLSLGLQVTKVHCNHCSFFFVHVEKFNEAGLECVGEVHTLLGEHATDVTFSQLKLTIFGNKERALYSSRVSVESDFLVWEVANDRDFFRNVESSPQTLDVTYQ